MVLFCTTELWRGSPRLETKHPSNMICVQSQIKLKCDSVPKSGQLFISFHLFGWLVADGWCWFALREEYCWLVAGGWFVVRQKYCWLVADKPSEQGAAEVQFN
jgi:hypothetical protein